MSNRQSPARGIGKVCRQAGQVIIQTQQALARSKFEEQLEIARTADRIKVILLLNERYADAPRPCRGIYRERRTRAHVESVRDSRRKRPHCDPMIREVASQPYLNAVRCFIRAL